MDNILVKYPTRQRPELFLKTLSEYITNASDNSNIRYLISYDEDDDSMTEEIISKAMNLHENVICVSGKSDSKIHACNRDVNDINWEWNIVLLVSDDMRVQVKSWDERIRNDFNLYYPDGDGCLWYHDGSKQKRISTLSCLGKKYYERFKYLYHPSYKSFFCDNEYTEIAFKLDKMTFIEDVIIKHQHYAWGGGIVKDDLYKKNDIHWNYDEANYKKRKQLNFSQQI